jgi:hypothetical protein
MSAAKPAAFSKGGALALIGVGVALFLGLLYLIGAGEDFGGTRGQGQAHAASNGLNGYSGLVRLVEAQGYSVTRSRSLSGLKNNGLLVLSPSPYAEADEIAKILKERAYRGPTLVILPKWFALPPNPATPPKARAKFKRGWVVLGDAFAVEWPADLPEPYAFKTKEFNAPKTARPGWRGVGLSGTPAGRLPTATTLYAAENKSGVPLITDSAGRTLALEVIPGKADNPAYPVIFVAEADLANNFGLADPARASAAVALIDRLAGIDDNDNVTFDMTLNGFGASENLLTLAFRPPFLAATLCLLLALLIIGWRAFMRFGPPAVAAGPNIAFGKRQLITNGAGMILRARRFALLAAPYAALSSRRIAERLGLSRPDPQAIDAALARRLPLEEPFTRRAARLEAAETPAEILAAAQALGELNTKLTHQAISGTITR